MQKQLYLALGVVGMWAGSACATDINIDGLAITCNNCHGANGVSVGPSMPSIGGLSEGYLKTVMDQYRSGKRYSTAMGRLLKGYSDAEIEALAKHYSQKPWVPAAQKTDDELVKQGAAKVAMCMGCHGKGGEMSSPTVPHLNGQWAKYLELEMMKYQDPAAAPPNPMMGMMMKKVKAEDIPAIAQYYASQK
jgi:sulfide dehydrogenase cytochrome subunit